jgi:hypothetical protein
MAGRRSHSKINQLPQELRDVVNQKIVEGKTYREIADWLKQMGQDIGKSSVAEHGKSFLSKLEQLRIVKEQAKTIVEESGDAPATAVSEAANQLAMQLIMETLIEVDKGALKQEKLTSVLKSLSELIRSSVSTEKLKLQYNKGLKKAIKEVKLELQEALKNEPELFIKMASLVDRVDEKINQNREDE